MGAEHRLARALLDDARRTFLEEVRGLTLDEALDAAGGYRSIVGVMKHVAGWSAVYLSYAVDDEPRHWDASDWPRGLRDTIEPEWGYLDEILGWFERSAEQWLEAVDDPVDLDEQRPVHRGGAAPFGEIVAMVAGHWTYHAGEINEILALRRAEAWEYGEEVEENHIDTTGHGVRPGWMTDEEAARFEGR
jgi:uncharacterized damage-inducible protein DinB